MKADIKHSYWIIIGLLLLATSLSFLDRQVLSISIIRIKEDLSITDIDYGFINSGFLVSYAIMFTLGGILIDKYGSRFGLAFSVGFWSFATLLHSLATSVSQFGLFRFMLGAGEGGCFPGAVKAVNEWVPLVLVALQPLKALDYSNGSTYMQLMNDDFCAVPEFAGVAIRMGKRVPDVIIGTLEDDPEADQQINEYCRIAKVLHDLKNAHLGHLGHPLNAMLDMHTDATMLTSFFGCHIVQCEANQLMEKFINVTEEEVLHAEKQILEFFDTPEPVSDPISMKLNSEDLRIAAKACVALENFIRTSNLDGLAYYYDGPEDSDLRKLMSNLIVGNSLLAARHVPVCGESDLKTLIALFIFDRLGIGGSFAEFHPIDFKEGFILVGHDGPHNISIADGKPVLRSLKKYHGKPGNGASVEFKIKEGPITVLSVSSTYNGKFKFVIAEGESVSGPIPPTGNTNTRGFFKPDIKTFLKRWVSEAPTHHFALGIGHHAATIEKIAGFLNIESKII